MSTTSISSLSSHTDGVRNYLSNVGLAFRSLIAALCAVKSGQSTEESENQPAYISPRARAESIWALHQLARQYDLEMPRLADELRGFASRD